MGKGYVIWFTGISGAGKTTLSLLLRQELEKRNIKSHIIDGEDVRGFFENDLGFTKNDRIMNLKRCTFASKVLIDAGIYAIVAGLTPYYEGRDFIRKKIENYVQIYLELSVDKAIERDTKGHYKKYLDGRIKNIAGLDDAYEIPRSPNIVIQTGEETIDTSIKKITSYLEEYGIIPELIQYEKKA